MASCEPVSPLPQFISKLIDEQKFMVVYGPFGTGKTRLAFEVAKYIMSQGRSVRVMATEPGTLSYARNVVTCVPYVIILAADQLVNEVVRAASEGASIIIDSINWPFRSLTGGYPLRALSFISAVLRQVGGFAVGQVSEVQEGEYEMSLGKWVLPWADAIAYTTRVMCKRGPCVTLTFIKPYLNSLIFELEKEGIRWVA
ncbi:MAG: PhoH family protein [Acidilobus sp.]|uniref:PhoH family protein n=1 Tax=Acidilobus sp. 7A TaxID=1577685 RepID=UPI000764E29C|nr:PhoH family protein [Acidilobus sp. 7A]AMD31076.1 hypothetical protein SE86_07305 [Acidilobus sp. 7A]